MRTRGAVGHGGETAADEDTIEGSDEEVVAVEAERGVGGTGAMDTIASEGRSGGGYTKVWTLRGGRDRNRADGARRPRS